MNTRKLILSAMLFAVGLVLPFVTMQIPWIGNMLLPMHIPVLLCGFVCGAPYGALVGFLLPLIRNILFGMPMLMNALCMAVELMVYGFSAGFFYPKLQQKKHGILLALVLTMILGRIVWGITAFMVYSAFGNPFTIHIFLAQALINAVPGIIIQLVFMPILVNAVNKSTGVM